MATRKAKPSIIEDTVSEFASPLHAAIDAAFFLNQENPVEQTIEDRLSVWWPDVASTKQQDLKKTLVESLPTNLEDWLVASQSELIDLINKTLGDKGMK